MLLGMGRPVQALAVSSVQRSELQALTRRPTTPQRQVWRAQIILHRAEGVRHAKLMKRAWVQVPPGQSRSGHAGTESCGRRGDAGSEV
jgi:hypothetical protein